ncbi:MAG: alpha/beta hydrolase [Maricaulaceae bacterium]|jgi:acetyl esterase
MALDPQAADLLALVKEKARPKPGETSVEHSRKINERGSVYFARQDLPDRACRDLTIPGPADPIPARLYPPADPKRDAEPGSAPAPHGLLVYFHGGGFVLGSIESHDSLCRQLADASGAAVLSVDYRLAPEHPFPAGLDDALAATRWAGENMTALGVEAGGLAVGGDSAGGNLAAVAAHILRDEGGPKIAFQLLIYPGTDSDADTASRRDFAEGYYLERSTIEWFHAQYLQNGEDVLDPRISPLRAPDLAGLPPTYLVTAGFDPLRDEGAAYARALKTAGVAVQYVDYPGEIHGFFNMTAAIAEASAAVDAAGDALRRGVAR